MVLPLCLSRLFLLLSLSSSFLNVYILFLTFFRFSGVYVLFVISSPLSLLLSFHCFFNIYFLAFNLYDYVIQPVRVHILKIIHSRTEKLDENVYCFCFDTAHLLGRKGLESVEFWVF